MQRIRIDDTTSALCEIPFTSVLASNLQSRISGATLANAAIGVQIKKGGVGPCIAGGAGTFTATDDANAVGVRGYRPAISERTLGLCVFVFTGTNMEPRECPVWFVQDDPFAPGYFGQLSGVPTTVSLPTNLNIGLNLARDSLVEILSGACAPSVRKVLSNTAGPNSVLTLDATDPLPVAPAALDNIRLITR